MTVVRSTRRPRMGFARAQAFTTTPGQDGWTIKDTSSSGTPTYLCVSEDGGAAKLTLAATSEAEIVTLYQNDVLWLNPAKLLWCSWMVKVGSIDSVTTLTVGLATAQNDTDDSVAGNLWARLQGSASTSSVVVESDNGTIDNDDVATGLSLGSDWKEVFMDFSNGHANISFVIDGQRVATSTTFSLSGVSLMQPWAQLQKASGTGTPNVSLGYFDFEYRDERGVS